MGLFNFRKKKKNTQFPITKPDREWVVENLKWLVQAYGYPQPEDKQIVFSEEYFPLSTKKDDDSVENLIADLKSVLNLQYAKVTFDFQDDIRDIEGLPYEIEGKPFQSGLIAAKDHYHIILAKSLLKHDKTLLSSLIYEFIKIRLTDDKLQYDTGEDADLFVYLAGVYLGFGALLYQSLVDIGFASNGDWQTKWTFVADLPQEVMAYALALFVDITDDQEMVWKSGLSNELESMLDKALDFNKQYPVSLVMKGEARAQELYDFGVKQLDVFDWELAAESFQKAVFLEISNPLKSDIYNNLGYCQMRMGDLERSMTNFHIAVEIDSNGYAFSNMAYVMILSGRSDAAKGMIEMIFEVNDMPGYAHRNVAMYHQALGDKILAEEHFQKALAIGEPVDLLEFHYSEFLFEQDKKEEAMAYLKKAVEKGEPEVIAQYQFLGF